MKKVKRFINSGKYDSIEHYVKLISKYDNVSFDLFDTLVKRTFLNNDDVFNTIGEKLSIHNFKERRVYAEINARNALGEVNLNQIYDYININSTYKKKAIICEQNIDLDCIFANKYFLNLYNKCVELNKNIFIITDTYYDKAFIINLLKKVGITVFKNIYVSSDIGLSKQNGKLFDYFLKKEKINASEVIHIGDSWKSDYIQCRIRNIKAIHIPRYTNRDNCYYTYQKYANYSASYTDYYSLIGYKKFGPFLNGYVHWILEELKKKNIKKVFFLSRDGWIMKKAFDLINNTNIKSYYLEVSRRSLRVPTIWINNSLKDIVNMISVSKYITISSFFEDIGLNLNDYAEQIKLCGYTPYDIIEPKKLINDASFNKLYDLIKSDLIINSKKEFVALKKYINLNELKGKFAIVDIGWAGSMQRYLIQTLHTLNIDSQIFGYYVGVADYYKRNEIDKIDLNLNGYLFDFKNNANCTDLRKSFVGLFEMFFLENNGSIKNYEVINDNVKVNRYGYEYSNNGKFTIEHYNIKKLQNAALDYITNSNMMGCLSQNMVGPIVLFNELFKLGTVPTLNDTAKFGDFTFLDDGSYGYLAKPEKMLSYFIHPKRLKYDLIHSRWKIGFMKRLLKIKLPYQRFYDILIKFK